MIIRCNLIATIFPYYIDEIYDATVNDQHCTEGELNIKEDYVRVPTKWLL